jgi:hypothetical protein
MNEYESWLTSELAFRRQEILNRIREVESTLAGLRERVEADRFLNGMGEIQVSGVLLDTAIAAYATERQALKNLKEMQP